jgi:histidine ammonia-lyase
MSQSSWVLPKQLTRSQALQYASATYPHKLVIDPLQQKKIQSSFQYVQTVVQNQKPVYGINTGFGALAHQFISTHQLGELQTNLIRSHCTGVGEPYSESLTRLIMLIRLHCLQQGHSGVSLDLIHLLCELLHHRIHPVIPKKGSVGASGDLAPLAHLASALIGEGEVIYKNKKMLAAMALQQCGLKPHQLGPKEGLALINGTTVMCALAVWCLDEMEHLLKLADLSSAMSLEGLRGTDQAFHHLIQDLKPHPGQKKVASNLKILLQGSQILTSHNTCHRVQDPYSLRCIPQVHGAIRQTFLHACEVVDRELNSVTDNPLIFPDDHLVISGGNFHGEALAFCMDYMAMGLSELGSICERRIEKMMNPTFSELPAFLTKDSGLHSGLMIAHVTVAALISENKILSHPASVDSIPTSTDKEDHVSMGVTAGLKLLNIIDHLKSAFAVELLCNTQAMDFLRPLQSSSPIEAIHKLIRQHVPVIEGDRYFHKDIEHIRNLIDSRILVQTVEQYLGASL